MEAVAAGLACVALSASLALAPLKPKSNLTGSCLVTGGIILLREILENELEIGWLVAGVIGAQALEKCISKMQYGHPAVRTNLIADALHNAQDGLALISVSSEKSLWPMFISLIAHEIPQEIADVALMRNEKLSTMKISLLNALAASTVLIAPLCKLFFGQSGFEISSSFDSLVCGSLLHMAIVHMLQSGISILCSSSLGHGVLAVILALSTKLLAHHHHHVSHSD